jgi:hypothetical protein
MVAGDWRVAGGVVLDADIARLRARVHENAERMWARTR